MSTYTHPVVHLAARESGSGSGLGWLESQAGAWRGLGHEVKPVPKDGQDHPLGVTCPICSH